MKSSDIRISCICVTEGRAEWKEWMLSGWRRQTHENKELWVVDSSVRPMHSQHDKRIHVISMEPKTGIGTKRNVGFAAASGQFVINWDDDDWHHPRKLETIANKVCTYEKELPPILGWRTCCFLDLYARIVAFYPGVDMPIPADMAVHTPIARAHPQTNKKCEDTPWGIALAKEYAHDCLDALLPISMIGIRHGKNASGFTKLEKGLPVAPWVAANLPDVWGDSTEMLDRIQERLAK